MSGADADEVRRGLEAALLGLQAMAAMMDRLGDLLVNWEARALLTVEAAGTWRLAVDELRATVLPARNAVHKAAASAPAQPESAWTMEDVRRGYDG